jgi:enoyl-CoA hydratase
MSHGFGAGRHNPPVQTVRAETLDGGVCRITMDRPELRNAQNMTLIDELDAAFDAAERDDAVRVVILAGAGPHFSAGHDLKESWQGTAPEGRWAHEQQMYVERCLRIHDFPKPTIAQVQGACIAAGLMLACMCDLIVASDDARFQNPVLRMTAAGVELGVEVWEIGARKAKEFLFTGEPIDAQEAWRLGLVNRVVPRAELEDHALQLARRIAQVEPVTLRMAKEQINRTLDLQGKRNALAYHFAVHQFMHATETSTNARSIRAGQSPRDMARERDADT